MSAILVLIAAFGLDLLLGDPGRLPHPVVFIGRGVAALERTLRPRLPATPRGEKIAGGALVLIVTAASFCCAYAVIFLGDLLSPLLGLALETFLLYQCLAAKSLRDAALAVYRELAAGDLAAARAAVGRIVGRDVAGLDADAIARATVETVAENTSDGVVAPMLFYVVGGVPLAVLYKAINTMDSMIGYKNERYLHFGALAARLDDAANFLPARVAGILMAAAAAPCGLDGKNAWRIFRRDRHNHSSPNSAHPEAACAGALGIRLGGDSRYGGRLVSKPSIGDDARPVEPEDIRKANRLLYAAALLCLVLCCGLLTGAKLWN